MLLIFEACFSLLSGYTTVLVYEYAAKAQGGAKADRAKAASTLNMCFQVLVLVG